MGQIVSHEGVDMLAAGSAWRILETEHTRLRHLLASIARIVDADAWQDGGPQLRSLRRLIQEFQEFETRTHRPKGVVLLGSMRGRSAEADQLLDVLEDENRQCERLLGQALTLLKEIEQGGDVDRCEVASVLRQHRELMMRQLDREDTALRSYTARLLTSEEWSAVASSISLEVGKVKGRRAQTKE